MSQKTSHRGWLKVVLILLFIFIVLVAIRIPVVLKKREAVETASFIESRRLTMSDVDGSNLPPVPDSKLVDATIEGVDANNNYIRDDVELAIFQMYPDDVEIRSEQLQYAQALQMYFTKVSDIYTWKAVASKESRAFFCLGNSIDAPSTYSSESEWNSYFKKQDELEKIVKDLVLNNEERKNKYSDINDLYMTTTGDFFEEYNCDLIF